MFANHLEKVTFARSGGMFFLSLGGAVILADANPGVDSEATQSRRPLTPEEIRMFAALDPARLETRKNPDPGAARDTYQWDAELYFAERRPILLRWYGATSPDITPDDSAGDLGRWVDREVKAVWETRKRASDQAR